MSENWKRASGTALADAVKYKMMMNMAPIFLWSSLQLGTHANSAALRCCNGVTYPETLERILIVSDGNGTSADDDWMQVRWSRKARRRPKANTKSRKELARPARALQTSTRARTVAELDIGRKISGYQVEERTTIQPITRATRRKARTTRKAKLKAHKGTLWKRISFLKQL